MLSTLNRSRDFSLSLTARRSLSSLLTGDGAIQPSQTPSACLSSYAAIPAHDRLRYSLSTRTFSANASASRKAHTQKKQQKSPKQQRQHAQRSYWRKAKQFLQKVKSGDIPKGVVPQKAEEQFLSILSTHENLAPSDCKLATDLINTAILNANLPKERLVPRLIALACQTMARSGHPQATQRMYEQIQCLLKGQAEFLVRSQKKANVVYNSQHMNDACSQLIHHAVMQAHGKNADQMSHGVHQKLNRVIRELEDYYEDASVPLVSDSVIEHAIILYLCHQRKPQEAFHRLQEKVQQRKKSDFIPFRPSLATFTSIVHGFAQTGQPEKAMEVLQWMLDQNDYSQKGDPDKINKVVPNLNESCFNALMHAYALSGKRNAGMKAEQTLEWMEQLHESHGMETAPTITSYNIAVNAWARSGHPDAPVRAETLLRQLNDKNKAGKGVRPSLDTWHTVMHSWANSNKPEAVERVSAILDIVESSVEKVSEVPAIFYTILVKAWEREATQRNTGKDVDECSDNILLVMERMKSKGVTLSPEIFNSVLTSLTALSAMNGVFCFLELEQQFRQGRISLVTRTFNIGLNAITTLNRPDAELKAFDVLSRMKHYSLTDNDVTPSLRTYNITLKALSRCHADNAAERAEELLMEMESMTAIAPDSVSYITCIIAWGRSSRDDKFARVQSLLDCFVGTVERSDEYANQRTNVAVFNAVLSVCYHNSDAAASVDTALSSMGQLHKKRHSQLRPDQTTYSSFFRVFEKSWEREVFDCEQKLKETFSHCIDDGYVTAEIAKTLSKIAPQLLKQHLGGDFDLKASNLPKSWSRNVKE